MKALKRIIYLTLALSLLPAMVTYFAYGSKLELTFLTLTLLFFSSLVYLTLAHSKQVVIIAFFLGVVFFCLQLVQLNQLWSNNEGGDPRVVLVFTLQGFLVILVLIFLARDIWVYFKDKRTIVERHENAE